MYSMQRTEERQARELVDQFLERELVPDDVLEDVTALAREDENLRALDVILRARDGSR
ncbi:hypothetical protein ACFQGT_00905 [Natrialbaceae archaeon GCM10025810]|uniref:hypothetical protein n=1 Tax=Halovalidus salilacus TaxID=3075124 RepID=UPI00360D9065